MSNNTKQRSNELSAIARHLLVERQVDTAQAIPVYDLASAMRTMTGCHLDTAKRHVVKAARVLRGEYVATAGGKRSGSGWKKGVKRKNKNVGESYVD